MTITPGQCDLTIYQGATFQQVFTWKDAAGAPVNLTGYSARMMARADLDDAVPFLSLTSPSGGIALGGSAGTVTLAIDAATTAAITAIGGVWDLELVDGAGTVTRLLEGSVSVDREVTR